MVASDMPGGEGREAAGETSAAKGRESAEGFRCLLRRRGSDMVPCRVCRAM